MTPFEPLGNRARWRILYEILSKKPTGATVTYEELAAGLDLDPDDDRHAIQMTMRRAAKESESEDKRALESVQNVGYRIVEAEEHLRLARSQQKRAGRALVRGKSKVVNVDLNGVDPEVRKAFEVVAQAFSMQMEMIHRTNIRQANLEDVISTINERSDRSESEIAALRERLERLESGDSLKGS